MTNKKYDTLVLIGRFEPVHNAHVALLRRAAELATNVIVIVGSANQPRTYKNPWTSKERELMLRNILESPAFPDDFVYTIAHNIDTVYNDTAWMQRVQAIVNGNTRVGQKIGIIGHRKEDTGFYLDMFPQWGLEEMDQVEPLNATHIRDLYFKNDANMNFIRSVVPGTVFQMMEGWKDTPEYLQIIREREHIETYKKQFAGLAYPPIFVTADAVVICSGHVLMVKRKAEPGKGLWALPGGFVNAYTDKSVLLAAIRELREETKIKVPAPVLIGSIKRSKVFDAVNRSARGRTITHAFLIELPNGELPTVKGSDDAEKAQWVPIADVKSDVCFEDHYEIIQNMIGA